MLQYNANLHRIHTLHAGHNNLLIIDSDTTRIFTFKFYI